MTFLTLLVTSPVWYWFKDGLRKRWLLKQKNRYAEVDVFTRKNPFAGRGWVVVGVEWGIGMFVFMGILYPYIIGNSFTIYRLLFSFVLWLVGGLCFGYLMKLLIGKRLKYTSPSKA